METIRGVRYSVETGSIVELIGLQPTDYEGIVAEAAAGAFNIPRCINIDGVSYFPLSEGIKAGSVLYARRSPPTIEITVVGLENAWGETSRCAVFKLHPRSGQLSPRQNDQANFDRLMTNPAVDEARRWADAGHLMVPAHVEPSWRWSSLKASDPPKKKSTDHVVLATSACQSQIQMVVGAASDLANLTLGTIVVEAFATLFPSTPLAQRIRYRIQTPDSRLLGTEYVDALTTSTALPEDRVNLLANLLDVFEGSGAMADPSKH